MGRIIEYTLVSADGVFSTQQIGSFMAYRDEAYYRDGQDVLMASEAMLYGRKTMRTSPRSGQVETTHGRNASTGSRSMSSHQPCRAPSGATRPSCAATSSTRLAELSKAAAVTC